MRATPLRTARVTYSSHARCSVQESSAFAERYGEDADASESERREASCS